MKRREFLAAALGAAAMAAVGLPSKPLKTAAVFESEEITLYLGANNKFDRLSLKGKKGFIAFLRDPKAMNEVTIEAFGEPLMDEVAEMLGEMANFFEQRMKEAR